MLAKMVKITAFVACMLALWLGSQARAQLSCLDEQGKPVDWFIGYKFPKLKGSELFKKGLAYSYITSNDAHENNAKSSISREIDYESKIFLFRFKELLLKYLGYRTPNKQTASEKETKEASVRAGKSKWVASEKSIGDGESVLSRTLAVAFDKKNKNVNAIFYNDDPSGTTGDSWESEEDDRPKIKPNSRRAHAKGVLLLDEKSGHGVWITHSVPRFPSVPSLPLEYPTSGTKSGQTFMCISFELANSGKQIVDHLVNMQPLVYHSQVSSKMQSMIPSLAYLGTKVNWRQVPKQPKLAQTIATKGGQVLQLFAKSTIFNADIYAGWIDQVVGSDLYVETWRIGSGDALNSSCPLKDYHINNVMSLKYNDQYQWAYSKDHSKWAISEDEDVGVVCIGDSNRVASQFKRGGGAVCMKCNFCHDTFSSTIQDVEPCSIKKKQPDVLDRPLMARIRESLDI